MLVAAKGPMFPMPVVDRALPLVPPPMPMPMPMAPAMPMTMPLAMPPMMAAPAMAPVMPAPMMAAGPAAAMAPSLVNNVPVSVGPVSFLYLYFRQLTSILFCIVEQLLTKPRLFHPHRSSWAS
jgi:hypothetical protein